MSQTSPLIITISRQLGSGGRYIGQKLAEKLDIYYADNEIIRRAAEKLSVLEDDLEYRDEKITSVWQAIAFSSPDIFVQPTMFTPTDRELFNAETEAIKLIAQEHSAVIVGRCGAYVLKGNPNHVSIFLHGDIPFRKKNIMEQLQLTEEEAEKMIAQSDKARAHYNHLFTQKEWSDARLYDISLDTGKTGLDRGVELILNYLELMQKI